MKVKANGIERTAIKFNAWGREVTCVFEKGTYANNKNLAIQLYCEDEDWGGWEPYCTLTVNLYDGLPSNRAFIDTNNCQFSIVNAMKEAGYMKETGIMEASGFCIYPLYEFSQDFLDQLDKEYKEGGMIY